ncbi:MAG: hypothetical protein LBU06_00915 [Desulfovibrio sp.]|jgi:hypothetical protein|nr:hypothetical protein [Desulfovibrio sp.]
MMDGTHILEANFHIVPKSFTRAGLGHFLFPHAEAQRALVSPRAFAGVLLTGFLSRSGLCLAPRIISAECVNTEPAARQASQA